MRLSDLDMGQLAMLLKALSAGAIRKVGTDTVDLTAGARAIQANAGEAQKLAGELDHQVIVTKLLARDEFCQSLEQADVHLRPADPAGAELVSSEARPREATALPSSTQVIQLRTALAGILMALGEPADQRTINLAQRALESLARIPTESQPNLASQVPVAGPKVLEAALLSRIALVLLDGRPSNEIVRTLLQTILPPSRQREPESLKQPLGSLQQVSEPQESPDQPRLPAYQPDQQATKSPEPNSMPSRPVIANACDIPGSPETQAASAKPDTYYARPEAGQSQPEPPMVKAGDPSSLSPVKPPAILADQSSSPARPQTQSMDSHARVETPTTGATHAHPPHDISAAGQMTRPVMKPVDPVYKLACLLADAKVIDAAAEPGKPASSARKLTQGDHASSQQPRLAARSSASITSPSPEIGSGETGHSGKVPLQPSRERMPVSYSETTPRSTPETPRLTPEAPQPTPEGSRPTLEASPPIPEAQRPTPETPQSTNRPPSAVITQRNEVQAEQMPPSHLVDEPAGVVPTREEQSGSAIPPEQASMGVVTNQPVQQLLNQRTDGPIPLFIETTVETLSGPRQVVIIVDQNPSEHSEGPSRSVSVHLSLQTDNLGPMAIDLTYGQGLSCVIAVNRSSMDLIQTSLPALRQNLTSAGLTVLSLSCQRALLMEAVSDSTTDGVKNGGNPDSSDSSDRLRQIDIRA